MSRLLIAALLGLLGGDPWAQDAGQRPIVIEEFTGTWCTFCYGAGTALDRIEGSYSRDEIIVVAYHKSDPYSTPFAVVRDAYYSVAGYPTALFNGVVRETRGASFSEGPAGISRVLNEFAELIQQERERTAGAVPFQLGLEGNVGPVDPELIVTVNSVEGYPRPVSAVFLITENLVPVPPDELQYFANKQPIYNAVVRAHLGTESVDLASPGSLEVSVLYEGEIDYNSESNLHPVVFIQDDETHEILGGLGEFSSPDVTEVPDWYMYQ